MRGEEYSWLIWAMLVFLTFGSVIGAEWLGAARIVPIIIFGIAIAKGQLVAGHFMETRRSPNKWNVVYRAWIVAIGLMLVVGTMLAPCG